MPGLSFESTLKKSQETDMKKLILLAMLGALVCGNAVADRWYPFDADKKNISFANLSSISCDAGVCSMWTGQVNIDKTKKYDSKMSYFEFKCKQRKIRNTLYAHYYKGKVINSRDYENATFSPVIPGTVGEGLLDLACGKRPPVEDIVVDISFLKEVPNMQKHMRDDEYQKNF